MEKKVDFDFHNCPACGSGMINLDGDSPGQETYSCGDCHAKWVQNYVYTDAYLTEEAAGFLEEAKSDPLAVWLSIGGEGCPFPECSGLHSEQTYKSVDIEDGAAYQRAKCEICGGEYAASYKLVNFLDFRPDQDTEQQREATIQEENRMIGEELEDLRAGEDGKAGVDPPETVQPEPAGDPEP